MRTRKGTTVYNPRASRLAIVAERYWNASEYRVYRSFKHREFEGWEGDNLLLSDVPDRPALAHAVHLQTGDTAIIPWDALAHSVKPAEARS